MSPDREDRLSVMRHIPGRTALFAATVLAAVLSAAGQTKNEKTLRATVTYVTASSVYLDAGSDAGLAQGDTLAVQSRKGGVPRIVIFAVSSRSSAARNLNPKDSVAIGDTALIVKMVSGQERAPETIRTTSEPGGSRPGGGAFHGRVAAQYAGAGQFGTPLDFSQPSMLLNLSGSKLFGTALTFSFYGRTYQDLSAGFTRYGQGSRTKMRLYDMTLGYDNASDWYGFSVGRITSRYVGGMGPFDGGQFYARSGAVTTGLLVGGQADYATSSPDFGQQKVAAFVNFAFNRDFLNAGDFTVAYGQQLYQGKNDRNFLYAQVNVRLASTLFFNGSSEIDLHKIVNGVQERTFRLTNTFVSLNYTPAEWLSLNGGYDATRDIYLFQSMKTFPDTLLDFSLRQGVRAGAYVRLPAGLTVSASANFRMDQNAPRQARTYLYGIRANSIAGSGASAGIRYASITSAYTDGGDVGADADVWLGSAFSFTARFDRYSYTLLSQAGSFYTTTGSLGLSAWLNRLWYTMLGFDQVWETSRRSQRVYLEGGYRF